MKGCLNISRSRCATRHSREQTEKGTEDVGQQTHDKQGMAPTSPRPRLALPRYAIIVLTLPPTTPRIETWPTVLRAQQRGLSK